MGEPTISLTVLGSGTSSGVPTIGCGCQTCASDDPRDKRLRPSVLVRYGGHSVLIDTTPDFRAQALRARIERLDAILLTHSHADHILGLDDVRPLNYHQRASIPVYGMAETLDVVRRVFQYAFDSEPTQSSVPRVDLVTLGDGPLNLFGLEFIPIRLEHGQSAVLGFRFGDAAYLTDHSEIPENSFDQLEGLDILFLDALRHKPHPTHSTVQNSLSIVERLKPKRAFFTHICHDLGHEATNGMLPRNVRLSHDGMKLEFEISGQ
jgi:phosphoribosyl 1,2-cyclic phosphate phosphodiesterase